MREVISTKDGPQAIGPYSQAIRANGFVFVSGQVAIEPGLYFQPDDATVPEALRGIGVRIEDDVAVTRDGCENLSAILQAAGSGLEKAVRSTVFLKNMSDFTAMNEVYGRYFTSHPPARSTVEVARLPKDVLVEIDVIALA